MMSYFLIVSTCIKMKTMKSTKEKKYSIMIIFHFGGHLGLKSYIVFCEILKILLILKKLHRLDFPTKFAYTLTKKLDVKFLTPPLQGKAEMIFISYINSNSFIYAISFKHDVDNPCGQQSSNNDIARSRYVTLVVFHSLVRNVHPPRLSFLYCTTSC